ncbi:hypothetical protein JTE90_004511 [Oedothorax gibbosus]|uniref:Urease accessory protein F n=1 Tax=Oedothorax gibbosus TaxID=931172 RepID=A0AAV6VCA3_9ARAC|nr:hypothetical protein JTE90_004511 [Oedothorax gibbosus]
MDDCNIYTILQICDSAFPTGGFSHSMGTEAALQNSYITDQDDLKNFTLCCLENAGSFCLPFVKAAHKEAEDLKVLQDLDSLHNASLLNHVAHRASKQQGRSFLTTSCAVFKMPLISQIKELFEEQKLHCHLPIVFAAVCACLNIPALKVGQMFIFNCLRTIIASIVRLGKVGTIQAQHLQFEMQGCLDNILMRYWNLLPEESYIAYPLPEVLQNSHDVMFSKLFFS